MEEDENIGKFVDSYKIVKFIGKGEFGNIYKANDIKNNKIAAIKIILKKKIINNEKLIELLNNEVQIMLKINHPHILKLYNYYESENNYYLILEYCSDGDLYQYLQKKEFIEENEAIFFLKQITLGFQELRKNKIMHRDIKLKNIYLKGNKIIIGDFGFSKFGDIGMTLLGSPITMAPEILNNSSVYTNKADLWSIGVIFYQLLFGKYPFTGKNCNYILQDILNNSKKLKFEDKIQNISEETKNLLINILKIDINERLSWEEFFNHEIFKKKKFFEINSFNQLENLEIDKNFKNLQKEIENNKITSDLKEKKIKCDDKLIYKNVIIQNDIIKINCMVYYNYYNMLLFFFKTINYFIIIYDNIIDNYIKGYIIIIIIWIYEKLKIIYDNISNNINWKINIFKWDFFDIFKTTDEYLNIIKKFNQLNNILKWDIDKYKNNKNHINLIEEEFKSLNNFKNNKINFLIFLDNRLSDYFEKLFKNKFLIYGYEYNKSNSFRNHIDKSILFLHYIINSEKKLKHFKKSRVFKLSKFYNKLKNQNDINFNNLK